MTGSAGIENPDVVGPEDVEQARLEIWAAEVGRAAVQSGLFVCLHGPLGAGKSTFARAACRGAGVEGPVPSPTFTLVNRHLTASGKTIWHADLYRLDSPELLVDVGWPELVEGGEAVFVEWAERAGGWLPPDRWEVHLSFADGRETRSVEIQAVGTVPSPPRPEEDSC